MPVQFRPDRIREVAQSRWIRSEQFRSWLLRRRWFGFRSPEGLELDVADSIPFAEETGALLVTLLLEAASGGRRESYHVPLRLSETEPRGVDRFLASLANQRVYGSEAELSQAYVREVVKLATTGATLRTQRGHAVDFRSRGPLPLGSSSVVASEETSHILIRLTGPGPPVLLKSYKRVDGANREPRMLEHLTTRGFGHIPHHLGSVAVREAGQEVPLGLFMEFIEDAVNLLGAVVEEVRGALASGGTPPTDVGSKLGEALAWLHANLVGEEPLFRPEAIEAGYLNALFGQCEEHQREARRLAANLGPTLEAQQIDPALLGILEDPGLLGALGPLETLLGSPRMQTHQDLHLAQILRRRDGELFFIDFEGEPLRGPQEKWRKDTPLRDLATLERSFGYAKHYVLRSLSEDQEAGWSLAFLQRGRRAPMVEALDRWEGAMGRGLERGYLQTLAAANPRLMPADATAVPAIVRALTVEKALYEVRYELAHRPGNVAIPLEALHSMLARP